MVSCIFLDQLNCLLDSLRDVVGSIYLLNGQLIFDVLHGVIRHFLNLGELERDWWHLLLLLHLRHHVVEGLLHVHELVVSHHPRRERLGLSVLVILLLLLLGCGKHHLHVDIWVHVHALARESHLPRHHHTTWEVNVTHFHVIYLLWIIVHFVWTPSVVVRCVLELSLSKLRLTMCVGAPIFISAVTV